MSLDKLIIHVFLRDIGREKIFGAAIVRSLASAGALVLVDYVVRPEEAQGLVGEINKNRGEGTAIAVQADISREEEVNRLFAQAKETFGGLDILVNNADNCY